MSKKDQAAELLRLVRAYGSRVDVASALEATRIATCRKERPAFQSEILAKQEAASLFHQIESLVYAMTSTYGG